MSKPEQTSDPLDDQGSSEISLEGTDVVMYMEGSGPEDCIEGYYWDGVQCVKKRDEPGIG